MLNSQLDIKIVPGRIICSTPRTPKLSFCTRYFDKKIAKAEKNKSLQNLSKKKSSFLMSPASKRIIKSSIMSLCYLSSPRTVKVSSNKLIYNYRATFLTLTLPSKQEHPDTEIKQCLNNFFTRLRQLGLKNYVWKAELQKNENIHFHIVIDKYFHHLYLRHLWNSCISPLGYVERYQEQWKGLSLREYAEKRGITVHKAVNGYQYGIKTDWLNPPVENAQSVQTDRQLSFYLQKYLAKDGGDNTDTERAEKFGKVWARSQSLSRLKYQNYLEDDFKDSFKKLLESFPKGFKKIYYDWVTVIYYELSAVEASIKKIINRYLRLNASFYSYPFN